MYSAISFLALGHRGMGHVSLLVLSSRGVDHGHATFSVLE
jgi:hypothetical protein